MGASTPEGKVKAKVVDLLKKHGVWYFFPGNNGFGKSGIPDIVCCVDGNFLGIEVKADKTKKPTALQVRCGQQIEAAGGTWVLVYDDITLMALDAVIENKKDR